MSDSPDQRVGQKLLTALARGLPGLVLLLGWAWLLWSLPEDALLPRTVAAGLGLLLLVVGLVAGPRLGRTRWARRLDSLVDLDPFAGRRWVAALGLYLAARLPLLVGQSYGADQDAWRMAGAALRLWRDHAYEASRLPGYPVAELALTPFVALGGPAAARLAVAAAGFGGLIAFDRLGRRLGARGMGLATATLGLAPLYVVSTSSAIDTALALALLLAAALSLAGGLRPRADGAPSNRVPLLGGVLVGLATGARLSTALLALPLFPWYRAAGARWRDVGLFALTAVEAAAVALFPVLATYRAGFLSFGAATPEPGQAAQAALSALGLLPLLALGFALGEGARLLWGRQDPPPTPEVGSPAANRALVAAVLLITLAVFAALPLQSGALLPALAAGLLLLALRGRVLSLALIGLAGLLALALEPGPGSLRGERKTREDQLAGYAELRAAVVPPGSVIVLGGTQFALAASLGIDLVPLAEQQPPAQPAEAPEEEVRKKKKKKHKPGKVEDEEPSAWESGLRDPVTDVRYLPRLSRRGWAEATIEGREIYLWNPYVDRWTQEVFRYSPLEQGAKLIKRQDEDVEGASAGWRASPRAAVDRVVSDDDRVTLSGWGVGPVRACLEPAAPVAEAGGLAGRARLRETGEGQASLRLTVVWEDAEGGKAGNTPLLDLEAAGGWVALDRRLDPPAGAARALVCARLEGAGAVALIEDLRLLP